MSLYSMKWEILSKQKSKNQEEIIDNLLKNREILTKKQRDEFFNPKNPKDLSLEELGISKAQVGKTIKRLTKAKENKEKIIVFGDYDADGVCATAVLWEALYSLGFDVSPYIPDRFSEGYGLNAKTIERLKSENPTIALIITVDNGIVAVDAVEAAKKLGIDVIITDHHLPGSKLPKARSIIHSTKTSGAGIAWITAREIGAAPSLDLTAIGVIADQMPLIGINRSLVKFGLGELRISKRPGLNSLYETSGINPKDISPYHINYIVAPRINAMGRLKHGMDSLRFLCTKSVDRARGLSRLLSQTNEDRQKIVDEAVIFAKVEAAKFAKGQIIVLANEKYHEGIIGLVASKIVEEYYRPVIVFSKGEKYSKASARSISGFNIIDALRSLSDMWVEGGGHSMAAGFTLETSKLEEFTKRINESFSKSLTQGLTERKLKVDLELELSDLNWEFSSKLTEFEPFGIGNPQPVFSTKEVEIIDAKLIGNGLKHLKMKLRKEKFLDAIYFGAGEKASDLPPGSKIDVAFSFEVNEWNGNKSLQLKVKDMKK